MNDNYTIETIETIETLYPYIFRLVEQATRHNLHINEQDIDDLFQEICIKFWSIQQEYGILSPKPYLRRMVINKIIDFLRKPELHLNCPIPTNEHGEPYEAFMQLTPAREMGDPAEILEKKHISGLRTIVNEIALLPPRQRDAMLFSLQNAVEDSFEIEAAFLAVNIDFHRIKIPQTPKERQMWQASCSVARRKLQHFLNSDLDDGYVDSRDLYSGKMYPDDSPLDVRPSSPASKSRKAEDLAKMLSFVAYLKEPYRTAIHLHYCEHLTYDKIATQLDLPIGTIKAHVSRGLSMLQHLQTQPMNEVTSSSILLTEIKARLYELKEPYQTTMRLRFVEGHPYQQIALQLNAPLGTVKARVSRGLRLMGITFQSQDRQKATIASSSLM